jgi:GNAT superfamily N-acetyltransferase
MLRPSHFDEEFLGVRCFRLTPPVTQEDLNALQALTRETPLFADVKLPVGDAAAARELLLSGFRKVCTQVQLHHDLTRLPDAAEAAGIADRLELPATAISAHAANFATGRYRQDARLDPERAIALYARWVENSTSGGKRVAYLGQDLCTFEDHGDTRQVDLVSVLAKRQGRGRSLMHTLLADARATAQESARVITEAENIAAMRLYLASGFQVEAAYSCFHFLHE